MTIIMASHFPDHAFLSAHKVGILKNNALKGVGAPDRVLTQALLEDTYETPIRVIRAGNEVDRKICVPLLNKALAYWEV